MKTPLLLLSLAALWALAGCRKPPSAEPAGAGFPSPTTAPRSVAVTGLRALPRMLRVDLRWDPADRPSRYEVRRAESPDGPFQILKNPLPMLPFYADVLGESGVTRYYQIRRRSEEDPPEMSAWSETVHATTRPFDREGFLTEVQEAGFRYFYEYAHPVSHLPREGIRPENSWGPHRISTVSAGMYFFIIAVGIEREFITREEGVAHVTTALRFLRDKVTKFHGAFPHWFDGATGEVLPFSATDDGADLVETAILAEGLLFAREYFSAPDPAEETIRSLADSLWRDIEWDHFLRDPGTKNVLMWHWSPEHGFGDLPVVGFNEAEIAYLLAIGSPTHPIDPAAYWEGWVGANPDYFHPRIVEGVNGPISLQLASGYGLPMFVMHYSYLGLDPHALPLPEGTLFAEFERLTLAQHDYARLNAGRRRGYDRYWGLTASLDPDGYHAHRPGPDDNGTLSPTAALSSIAYQPEKVLQMMEEMYLSDGAKLWGPFGFFDAFNPDRNWIATAYIGIDVGPIGPMIENYRSGKLWQVFMQAPEIQTAIDAYLDDPGNPFPKSSSAPESQ